MVTAAHLALLHHVAANEVKAMRRSDGTLQVWVDGTFVDGLGGVYNDLAAAGLVEALPAVAPKTRTVTVTDAGRSWLAQNESEAA